MREKWRVRRGWIKIHAMIDIKTDQNLDLEVRDESVQDDPMFTSLLDQATENCGKVHPICQIPGDGGYDRVQVFNTMENEESNQEPKHGRMLLQEKPGLELYNTAASGGNGGMF